MNHWSWIWLCVACLVWTAGCLHEDRRFVNEGSTVVRLPEVSKTVSTVRARAFAVPRWSLDDWPDGHLARCVRDREWTMSHIPMDYVLLEITGREIRFMGEPVVALMSDGRLDPAMLQFGVLESLDKRLKVLSEQLDELQKKGVSCLQPDVDTSGVFDGNVLMAVEEGVFKETYMNAIRTLQKHGFDQLHFWVTDDASKLHRFTPDTQLMVMKVPGRYRSGSYPEFLGSEFRALANVHSDTIVLGPVTKWHTGAQAFECAAQSCDQMDAVPRARIYDFATQLKRERPHLRQIRVCVADGSTYAGLMGTLESLYPYGIQAQFLDSPGHEVSWLHIMICGTPPKIDIEERNKKPVEIKAPSAAAALLGRSPEPGEFGSLRRSSATIQLSHSVLDGPQKNTALNRALLSSRDGIERCLTPYKKSQGSVTLRWILPTVRWGTPRNVRIVRTSLQDFKALRCVAETIAESSYRDVPHPRSLKERTVTVQWSFSSP